jgi:cytochrome bd ubiquinol oxidase subunit II
MRRRGAGMWSLESLAYAVVHIGLVMYAVFGGADFGGGIWTALARGPRAREQRSDLFHAIGPVWETNHVWLIFVVVALFTAFPKGFAALFTVLLVPLVLALVGINFRGAAFAFRNFGRETSGQIPFMVSTFAVASLLTPFALGIALTATASGKILWADDRVQAAPYFWVEPFTLMGGVIAMAVCAYLTPIFMTLRSEGALQEDFRRQGMIAGTVLGALTAAEIPVALAYAPLFAARLLSWRGASFVALAAGMGVAALVLLRKNRFLAAQLAASAAVALTLTGFAAAMYPDLLIGQLTLAAAAAPRATLRAFLGVCLAGVFVLVPSLWFLYRTFRGEPNSQVPP